MRNSLGVIGDLGDALGDPIVPYFKNEEFVKVLYQDGMVQGSDSTRRIAEWCSTVCVKEGYVTKRLMTGNLCRSCKRSALFRGEERGSRAGERERKQSWYSFLSIYLRVI